MSRLVLLFVLLTAVPSIAFAECTCPDNGWPSSYEDTASSGGIKPFFSLNDQVIGCGYVERREREWIIASEFSVFRCEANNKLKLLLLRDALTEARIIKTKNSVVITEFEYWPFGKNWKWVEVPTVRHAISPDTQSHQEVSSRIVLKPVSLTTKQIAGVLGDYARFKKRDIHSIPTESVDAIVETMIGKLLVVALAGSEAAYNALGEMKQLDAHYGETATQALKTYYLYRTRYIKEQ